MEKILNYNEWKRLLLNNIDVEKICDSYESYYIRYIKEN